MVESVSSSVEAKKHLSLTERVTVFPCNELEVKRPDAKFFPKFATVLADTLGSNHQLFERIAYPCEVCTCHLIEGCKRFFHLLETTEKRFDSRQEPKSYF